MLKTRERYFLILDLEKKSVVLFFRSEAGKRLTCNHVPGFFERAFESQRLVRHLQLIARPTGKVGDDRFVGTKIIPTGATGEAGVAKMGRDVLPHTSHSQSVVTTDDQTPHFARLTGHAVQKLDMIVDGSDVVGDDLVAFADKVLPGLALSDLDVV